MAYTITKIDASKARRTRTTTVGTAGEPGYSSVSEEQIIDILVAETDINQQLLQVNSQITELQKRRADLIAQKDALTTTNPRP